MGISRDNWHKRRKTGGKRKPYNKKRKDELGFPAANTDWPPPHAHSSVQGGNKKYCALKLDVGNFSWGSERCTRKTRIFYVVYNASNNDLVCTKTLIKNCIVLTDSTPPTDSGTNPTMRCPRAARRGQGKLLACIPSRPGHCGGTEGYVIGGKEPEFYLRKIKAREGK